MSILKLPPGIFVQTSGETIIYVYELPNIITISSKNYQLLCASIHRKNHFRSLFRLNNSFILVDDLKPSQISDTKNKSCNSILLFDRIKSKKKLVFIR